MQNNSLITAKNGNKTIVLQIEDIFMISIENKQAIIYDENKKYTSKKRLYEFEEILGNDFFRISKSTIINLKKINSVSPSIKGLMMVKMKNGLSTIISRNFLPKFKKHLGL